jgi:hypothetical protein
MTQYLSNLREHTNSALKDFSVHPVKYTYHAAREFVKDYWDIGTIILAGFALSDKGNEVFGAVRPYLMIAGPIAMLMGGRGSDDARFARNILTGVASMSAFWTRGMDSPLAAELGSYATAAFFGSGAAYIDLCRRRNKKTENSQLQNTSESLEAKLN